MDTQIIGISVDSPAANKRFAEDTGATFPLLSDFQRKVSKDYGILEEERGWARRTTFVLDKEGRVQHIEQGGSTLDPSGAYKVCSLLHQKR